MRRKVYIETSVASYLTARPSRDLVVAAHQQLTLEWWNSQRSRFDLYVSEVVIREAARGDAVAAARRLAELKGIPMLPMTRAAEDLADHLRQRRIVPAAATEDAAHVAIAVTQGMDYLLTWNCKHIAHAEVVRRLEEACLELGLALPVLCTPEQLVGY